MHKSDEHKDILNESQLIKRVKRILEGDVISFADYKARKQTDNVISQVQDNILRDLDKNVYVDITGVDIIWAEGRVDGTNSFKDGEKLSYEEFQKRAYEYDYALRDRIGVDKVKVTVHFIIDGEEDSYNTMIYIGDDKNLQFKDVDLARILARNWKEYFGGKQIIVQNAINPSEMNFNNLQYAQPEEKEPESDPMAASYIRDYRKNPQDVQVGDILVCSWGYSMHLIDYYRVTERKAKSIRLEKLQAKILTGGGYQGTCIPSDEAAPERFQDDVRGKLFRIGVKWSSDVVCRINDHSVYFWDGKPDSYDHMD